MVHDEVIANCTSFRGWHKENLECVYDGPSGVYADWWCDEQNKIVVRCADYDPCADTPEGREQANELKKKLREMNCYYEIRWCPVNKRHTVMIRHETDEDAPVKRTHTRGVGFDSWCENSALAAAVSALVEASKRRRNDAT